MNKLTTTLTTVIAVTLLLALATFTASQSQAQMAMMGTQTEPTTQTQPTTQTSQETDEHGHDETVAEVLGEILARQNVATVQDLDCSQVSDEELERLGDAVMEQQHPGEAHIAMDQMMGGEGSGSLRQMHIGMGSAYLGCSSNYGPGMMNQNNYRGGGMMGMMGPGSTQQFPVAQQGYSMMGFGNQMGYGLFAGASVLGLITWLMVIAFLGSGTYFFLKGGLAGSKKS